MDIIVAGYLGIWIIVWGLGFGVVRTTTAMSIPVVSFEAHLYACLSVGCILRSGIAKAGMDMNVFSFRTLCQMIFRSGRTHLQPSSNV